MSRRSLLYTSGLAEDTCAEHNDEGVRRLRQLKTPKLSTLVLSTVTCQTC